MVLQSSTILTFDANPGLPQKLFFLFIIALFLPILTFGLFVIFLALFPSPDLSGMFRFFLLVLNITIIVIFLFLILEKWRILRLKTIIDLPSGTVTIKKGTKEFTHTVGTPQKFVFYSVYARPNQVLNYRIDLVGDQGTSPLGFHSSTQKGILKSAAVAIKTLDLPLEDGGKRHLIDVWMEHTKTPLSNYKTLIKIVFSILLFAAAVMYTIKSIVNVGN